MKYLQTNQTIGSSRGYVARHRKKISLTQITIFVLLFIGFVAVFSSVIYVSSIISFIGLSLILWGVILTYVRSEDYVRKEIMNATVIPQLINLKKLITELKFEGNPIYLPSNYFTKSSMIKLYVSRKKEDNFPISKKIDINENQLFSENIDAILLTPPGAYLAELFEKKLEIDFSNIDLNYLMKNIPKVFSELEIAEKIIIKVKDSKIKTTVMNSYFNELQHEEGCLLTKSTGNLIVSPISSAIACVFTKVTGKAIKIENLKFSKNGKVIHTTFSILENFESQLKLENIPLKNEPKVFPVNTENLLKKFYHSSNLYTFLMTTIGSSFLAYTAWLVLSDVIFWQKDLVIIFFGSRMGEEISLGLGFTVMHYLIIGSISLFAGIFMYLRKRNSAP